MISALRPNVSESGKMAKEIEMINDMHQKELVESKQRQQEITNSLERQISELKLSNAQRENECKAQVRKTEEVDREYREKLAAAETRYKELEGKVARLESCTNRQQEAAAIDAQARAANAGTLLEKAKCDHVQELEKTRQTYEAAMKEIKFIYEREKMINEARLEKANNEIRMLQSQKDSCNTSRNLHDIQETYLEEIRELNAQLDSYKKQAQEELDAYKKQRDEAALRADSLEQEIAKIKKTAAPAKERTNQSGEEIDSGQDELRQTRKQVADLKSYIAKLEARGADESHSSAKKAHDKSRELNLPRKATDVDTY